MCDFDITSFRDKSSTSNTQNPNQGESTYTAFLEKRKLLGLDDSDSDSDSDEDSTSKKQKKKLQPQQQDEPSKPTTSTIDTDKNKINDTVDIIDNDKQPDQIASTLHSQVKTELVNKTSIDLCNDSTDSSVPIEITDAPITPKRRTPALELSISMDIEDLDPELAELTAEERHTPATTDSIGTDTEPQKVQIKVTYVSLLETVDPVLQNVINILSKPVKVIMMDNHRFDTLLGEYCKKKRLMMKDMILVYENVPVVLRATPSSLSMSTLSVNKMEVYKRDEFERKMKLEQEIKAARLSQLAEEGLEMDDDYHEDYNNNNNNNNSDHMNNNDTSIPQDSDYLHIKLRGKDKKDVGLRVKPTTTVESMVKQYIRLMGLDMTLLPKIQLSFEGETLAPSTRIEDTELEDEDMLSVMIHS
ncbi:ubiquitin-2 like Rad60 SUMO-like-domain-containing protein [Halteromyces radiatus]|uniref:ubiquitin-2 like Rad60 SUMO-like-domain-containing protein n=1 Tax=Halteromyces radiatus TaxID=101107 RepID=UPI00221F9ACD|nr:ubiquitin-2 like Rad60 SUMO-like-domain-containing protein [Halteromyces radiatus]KAI8099663.1 ubiquitin-2 like Rad60 SUMO-like-domain-containing protein [Halteromyces radiatus]